MFLKGIFLSFNAHGRRPVGLVWRGNFRFGLASAPQYHLHGSLNQEPVAVCHWLCTCVGLSGRSNVLCLKDGNA